MDALSTLYSQWLNEKNKGHYKNSIIAEQNPLDLFGNQDFMLTEIEKLFDFYNIKLSGSVLDVGCSMGGGGLYSFYYSDKFSFVAGVDVDQTAIAMAKEYKRIKGIQDKDLFIDCASIYKLPFQNEIFDLIIMKDVGEHLETRQNLELALIELKRVLKDDGHIFIETPNYLFPLEAHLKIPMLPYISTKKSTKIIAKMFGKDPGFISHLNFTTPKMFEEIFAKNNFRFLNAYEEYKLPYLFSNPEKLSDRFKFLKTVFKVINKIKLDSAIVSILRSTKLYPSLWYIVSKK